MANETLSELWSKLEATNMKGEISDEVWSMLTRLRQEHQMELAERAGGHARFFEAEKEQDVYVLESAMTAREIDSILDNYSMAEFVDSILLSMREALTERIQQIMQIRDDVPGRQSAVIRGARSQVQYDAEIP